METWWGTALWRQFGAAIDTLDKALVACPVSRWTERLWPVHPPARLPPPFGEFWYVGCHIEADAVWFSQLRGAPILKPLGPIDIDDREAIRARWDVVEQKMREYLAALRDELLFTRPFPDHPEDKDLIKWQVLVHVVNHGTDHRAQVLWGLNDLGVETESQDYVFYAYNHPLP